MFNDTSRYDHDGELFNETFEDGFSDYEIQDIEMKEDSDSWSEMDFEDWEYLYQEYTDEEIFKIEKVRRNYREKLARSDKNDQNNDQKNVQKNVQKEGLSDVEKELLNLHHNLSGNKSKILDHIIRMPRLLFYVVFQVTFSLGSRK